MTRSSLLHPLAWSVCVGLLGLAEQAFAQAMGQPIGQAADSLISPWRVVASLVFCLVLGGLAIVVLRRRFGTGQGPFSTTGATKRIRLLEQHYLGPQRSICLIEIDDRRYAALFATQSASLVPLEGAGGAGENVP